ncbi:C1orf101 [Bugula neritina]|uniref:C1orf101 n=1 Tax=Bugula neritina TaxID=10212 RepID=A0A7J7JCP2_BUGNE|nr:C1orf101 [Bugula neritina]
MTLLYDLNTVVCIKHNSPLLLDVIAADIIATDVGLFFITFSDTNSVLWRYTNLQRHSGRATTRDLLKLEVITTLSNVTDDQLQWSAPNCTLSRSHGKLVYLQCTKEGAHEISLNVANQSTLSRRLRFTASYDCYSWYIAIRDLAKNPNSTDSTHSIRDEQLLHVWVYDNLKASPAELNGSATEPSTPYSLPKYTQLSTETPTYHMTIESSNPTLFIYADAGQSNVAVVGVDGSLYITQDHLSSLYLLPAPEGVTSNLKVISLALMYNNIVVLDTTNKIYYLSTNSSQFQLYQAPDGFSPTYIASQDWLIEGLFTDSNLDLLAMTDGKELWLSNNLGPARQILLPVEQIADLAGGKPYSFEIHDVSFDIKAGRLGLAIKLTIDSENKIIFPIHDMLKDTWVFSPFWVDFKKDDPGRISLFFLGLAQTGFFFRNQHSLFYSYDDSSSYGIKYVYENTTELAPSPNFIRDVIVTKSGELSILLSNHQILYGKVKQRQLAKLGGFYSAGTADTVHWFDDLNQLWLVTGNN